MSKFQILPQENFVSDSSLQCLAEGFQFSCAVGTFLKSFYRTVHMRIFVHTVPICYCFDLVGKLTDYFVLVRT